jgi:hypothetical protein
MINKTDKEFSTPSAQPIEPTPLRMAVKQAVNEMCADVLCTSEEETPWAYSRMLDIIEKNVAAAVPSIQVMALALGHNEKMREALEQIVDTPGVDAEIHAIADAALMDVIKAGAETSNGQPSVDLSKLAEYENALDTIMEMPGVPAEIYAVAFVARESEKRRREWEQFYGGKAEVAQ